jgi:hypothetical protein
MSKSAEAAVLKRKLSPAKKRECYKELADFRQKRYSEVTAVGVTPDEFEVLEAEFLASCANCSKDAAEESVVDAQQSHRS